MLTEPDIDAARTSSGSRTSSTQCDVPCSRRFLNSSTLIAISFESPLVK
jgi:hypothetical protein